MSDLLVSVVIPLFNKEKYISSTLKSVIAQDYKNVELILIDDGSTDKGYSVACELLEDNQSRFSRVVTIFSPIVAEMNPPIPMLCVVCLCSGGILVCQMLQEREKRSKEF